MVRKARKARKKSRAQRPEISSEILAGYRKWRAKGFKAETALALARPVAFPLEWDTNGDRATGNVEGFRVTLTVRPEEHYSLGDSGLGTFERDFRDGDIVRFAPGARSRELRFFRPAISTAEEARALNRAGHSRGEAWRIASQRNREAMARAVEWQPFYLVVHAYREGIELGIASLGCCDLDDTRPQDDAARVTLDHGLISEAIEQARAALERLCPARRTRRAR